MLRLVQSSANCPSLMKRRYVKLSNLLVQHNQPWATLSFAGRGAYLHRFRDVMLDHSDTIAQLISQEVGKPQIEGLMSEIMAGALTKVTHEMKVMNEETFGPLLPIMVVEDDEEAIRMANDSIFGLDAYVFSKDGEHANRVARRIEAGTVMINDVIASYSAPETPWGGVKQSGIGRVHGGALGLKEFCQVRHIMGERIKLPMKRELWWFPYRNRQIPLFKRVLKLLFGGKK